MDHIYYLDQLTNILFDQIKFYMRHAAEPCIMICQCMRRSWEHGTKDKVLNFESAIMCTNNVIVNVVVMNLHINY